jgi:hypothetical protein
MYWGDLGKRTGSEFKSFDPGGQSYKANFGIIYIEFSLIEEKFKHQKYKQNLNLFWHNVHLFWTHLHQNSDIKIRGKIFSFDKCIFCQMSKHKILPKTSLNICPVFN